MKTKSNLLILLVIIAIILLVINYGIKKSEYKNDFSSQLDSLAKVNDSLALTITENQSKIKSLDSLNHAYESDIKSAQLKLGELNGKAVLYKNLYNEERNRIDNLSTPSTLREFTESFK